KKTLPVPPYTFGAFLGDGSCSGGTITNPDDEIKHEIEKELGKPVRMRKSSKRCPSYALPDSMNTKITGLIGKVNSYDKFIPYDYLHSSTEDRLALLQGLMDTDGYASGDNNEFSTSSKRLAEDIAELVRGLGGVATINNRGKKWYSLNGVKKLSTRDAYAVQVLTEFPPFRLKRKIERSNLRKLRGTGRYIDKIEFIGNMETRCIKVDNPTSLYITDNCTVTHNTSLLIPMGKAAGRVVNDRRAEMLVFSWELGPDYVADRFVCHELGISLGQLRYPKILPDHIRKEIPKTYQAVSKYPIHYHGQSSSIESCMKIMDKFLEELRVKEA